MSRTDTHSGMALVQTLIGIVNPLPADSDPLPQYWRSARRRALELAVCAPIEAPTSITELMARLTPEALADLWADHPDELAWIRADAAAPLPRQVIAGVRAELALFFQDEPDAFQ